MTSVRSSSCILKAYKKDGELFAILSGVLRMQNCEDIKNLLLPVFDESVKVVYLFMAGLTEIDSAGLGVLVGLHMTTRKNKQILQLLAPNEFQLRLLQVTRLNTVFGLIGSDEAEPIRQRLELPELALALPEVFEA